MRKITLFSVIIVLIGLVEFAKKHGMENMSSIKNPNFILKKSWVWEKEIQELVKSLVKGYSLNISCGKSKIGDIKADLDPEHNPDKIMDYNDIEYPNCTFDTVIQDPAWKIKNYFHRMVPFFECVRVCKLGGRIIYNAPWIPTSKSVKLIDCYTRQSARFGNVSIISIFEKVTNSFDGKKGLKYDKNQMLLITERGKGNE